MKLILEMHGFVRTHETVQATAPLKVFVPIFQKGKVNTSEVLTSVSESYIMKRKPIVMYEFKFAGYKKEIIYKDGVGMVENDVAVYTAQAFHDLKKKDDKS